MSRAQCADLFEELRGAFSEFCSPPLWCLRLRWVAPSASLAFVTAGVACLVR
jgi:hypothetical protein